MKTIKLYSILTLVIVFLSCSSNDDNSVEDAISQQGCENITGPTAVYWDYANGIPAPFNSVPVIQNPQFRGFTHSVLPYIGMSIPQGYFAQEITILNTQTYGVNLWRNDGRVLWKYVPSSNSFPVNFSSTDIMSVTINNLLKSDFNYNGLAIPVCRPADKIINELGIERTFSARVIDFGTIRAVVWVNITKVPGLPNAFVATSVSAAPVNEFDTIALDIFFPLSFELLVRDRVIISDRDGDGVPDEDDRDPDNPNVQ